MIYLGLAIGLYLGFLIGICLGTKTTHNFDKKFYNEMIEQYKKDEKHWFDAYLEMRGWYNKMTDMWLEEKMKNMFK